jgi:hypothetical protein
MDEAQNPRNAAQQSYRTHVTTHPNNIFVVFTSPYKEDRRQRASTCLRITTNKRTIVQVPQA